MTDLDETQVPIDGRVARRERNISNVLDVVIEMFAEEALFPSIEQASKRSGLSLRSLYRYFGDPSELLEAAIKRNRETTVGAAHLPSIGHGALAGRVDDFSRMRVRLYERVGPTYRATVANAARHSRIRDELARTRDDLRHQLELQFAPELGARQPAEREAVVAAGDVATQLDSIDFLRRHRQLSVGATEQALRTVLLALLAD